MIPVADPFMAGHEPPTRRPGDFTRSKRGTPYVSDPTGRLVKPKRKGDPPRIATTPYSRPSGFGKIIEDMYSIHKWDQRQEAYGFAVAPELVERAAILIEIEDRESDQWKDEADKIIGAAKAAAKASLAADRGTHAHELTEDDDEGRDIITRIEHGEEIGLSAEVQRSLVTAWQDMLERDGLEILAVESPVVNDTYRGAGTLDRVGRLLAPLRFRLVTGEIVELPVGWTGILDVKSGKRRLRNDGTVMYWHGYAVQVFLYANGVPYDTETDTRGEWEWEIDQRWALIAHLDVLGAIDGKPSCDLILVDLEAGRRAADLCVAAKAWSNEATVFSVAQIVVDPHYKCQHFLMGGVGHCWINHDQIVEGVEALCDLTPGQLPIAPSTLSPVHPPAAGEGADVSSGTTPSPATPLGDLFDAIDVLAGTSSAGAPEPSAPSTVGEEAGAAHAGHSPTLHGCDPPCQHDIIASAMRTGGAIKREDAPMVGENSANCWPLADPSRLALVDARGTLCATPGEGADLTDGFDELWGAMFAEFTALPDPAKLWRGTLVGDAQRALVPFHVQEVRTERTYHINKGVIALAAGDGDHDEILRALLALVLGEVAYFPGLKPGHILGSMTATQAEAFAGFVDAYFADGLTSSVDPDGHLVFAA